MKISKVSTYDIARGFGFIDDFSENETVRHRRVFFHIHDWKGRVAPQSGMTVRFELGPSRQPGRADVAINVAPADEIAVDEILNVATKESGVGGDK